MDESAVPDRTVRQVCIVSKLGVFSNPHAIPSAQWMRVFLANRLQGQTVPFSQTNRLLEALPVDAKSVLMGQLEAVTLPVGTVLFEAGAFPRFDHFMTSGIASVVTNMSKGDAVEMKLTQEFLGEMLGARRSTFYRESRLGQPSTVWPD